MGPNPDRRQHARTPIDRPCKVYHRASRQYLAARTCDLSSSGALIRVDSARPINPGDELDVFIAWGKKPVVNSGELVPATVVRVAASLERHQAVAVQFAGGQQVALVA